MRRVNKEKNIKGENITVNERFNKGVNRHLRIPVGWNTFIREKKYSINCAWLNSGSSEWK